MKKILYVLFAAFLGTAACKKITTADVTTRIVTPSFPGLTLKGEPVVSTGVGTGTFTDPGATGYDSVAKISTDLQPLVNTVDLTTPGFYSVQYEAKNIYGYRSNSNRLVLVTSVAASDDISGVYTRTNGQEVTLTKKGAGLYSIDNIGGVAGNPDFLFPIYVGIPTETSLQVPPQPNPLGGDVFVTGGTLIRTATTITFSYVVRGSGFGTATRTFVKEL